MKNEEISELLNFLIFIARKNNCRNKDEVKKYLYTHNLAKERSKMLKLLFKEYGEDNVLECVSKYITENMRDKELLLKKVKGEY